MAFKRSFFNQTTLLRFLKDYVNIKAKMYATMVTSNNVSDTERIRILSVMPTGNYSLLLFLASETLCDL